MRRSRHARPESAIRRATQIARSHDDMSSLHQPGTSCGRLSAARRSAEPVLTPGHTGCNHGAGSSGYGAALRERGGRYAQGRIWRATGGRW